MEAVLALLLFAGLLIWAVVPDRSLVKGQKAQNNQPRLLRTEEDGGAHTTWKDEVYSDGHIRRIVQHYSGGERTYTTTKWLKDGIRLDRPPAWA